MNAIWRVTSLRSDRISHIYCERGIPEETSYPLERNEIEQFTFSHHNAHSLLMFTHDTSIKYLAQIYFLHPADCLRGFIILLVLHSPAFPNIIFLHIYLQHLLVSSFGDFVWGFICRFVFKECYRTFPCYSGKTGFDAIFTLEPKSFNILCLLVH